MKQIYSLLMILMFNLTTVCMDDDKPLGDINSQKIDLENNKKSRSKVRKLRRKNAAKAKKEQATKEQELKKKTEKFLKVICANITNRQSIAMQEEENTSDDDQNNVDDDVLHFPPYPDYIQQAVIEYKEWPHY